MNNSISYESLGNLIKISHGYAFKSNNFETNLNGANPIVLTPGNYSEDSKIYFTEKNTKRVIGEYSEKYLFDKYDLTLVMTDLSSKMKILGKPAFIESDNILHNQRIGRVEFKTDKLLPRYLYYYFNTDNYLKNIKKSSTGTMVKHTAPKRILDNIIYLPSLIKQKQIVAILDQAFASIDQAKAHIEKNIQNAQELFQSKLNEIFAQKGEGWEEKSWNDVLEIRSGRNQKQVENPEGKYPILGSAGKTMGFADDYICEAGTTIIGRKGTINNPMYIETKFWNVDTAFGLHANVELNKKFLFFFCMSYDFTQRDKGSGRPSLVKKDLLTMKMPVPDLYSQKDVVSVCENLQQQLNYLEKGYQDKINTLQELKKSILQKAFTGELT